MNRVAKQGDPAGSPGLGRFEMPHPTTEQGGEINVIDEVDQPRMPAVYRAAQHRVELFRGCPQQVGDARDQRAALAEREAVPYFVAGSDRMGLIPEQVGRLHNGADGTVVDLPFELAYLVESLWWHPFTNATQRMSGCGT